MDLSKIDISALQSELGRRNQAERDADGTDYRKHRRKALKIVIDAQLANPRVIASVREAYGWAHLCGKPPHIRRKGQSFCSVCGVRQRERFEGFSAPFIL